MELKQIASLGRKLVRFLALFADCFGRQEPRELLAVYVRGQLSELAWIFTSINKLRIWARSVGLRHTAGSLLWAPWIIV